MCLFHCVACCFVLYAFYLCSAFDCVVLCDCDVCVSCLPCFSCLCFSCLFLGFCLRMCVCVCVCQCLFVFVQRWFASAGLMVMIVYVCVVRLLVRLCVCLRVCVIGRCKHEFTNKHLRRQATKHEVETNDPTYKQTTTTQQLHTTTTTIGTTT